MHGTLFFASCTTFLAQFEPAEDPQQVTLDCRHLSFVDYSAIAALKTLRERYERAGKHLRVVHLSEPVSYTHLDVYKRQEDVRALHGGGYSILLVYATVLAP